MGSIWYSCNKVSAGKTSVFLSAFDRLFMFNRCKVATLTNPLETPLSFITIFGSSLLALTEDGKRMLIWNTVDGGGSSDPFHLQSLMRTEMESIVLFDHDFTATSILHPATYINKVLVASSQGALQLWNIKTRQEFRVN